MVVDSRLEILSDGLQHGAPAILRETIFLLRFKLILSSFTIGGASTGDFLPTKLNGKKRLTIYLTKANLSMELHSLHLTLTLIMHM